ncbi:MAG: hypothetical protein NVSMB19_18490 [Vulcanimicrobiaceae bacterium]
MADLTATTTGLNPTVYYRLNDTSGTVAVDTQAHSNGTYGGSPLPTFNGPALTTNDANSAAFNNGGTVATNLALTDPLIANAANFTVSAWVEVTNTFDNARFVANSHTDSNIAGFQLYASSATQLRFDVYGTALASAISGAVTVLNTRHHCVGVVDSVANAITLYVDGVSNGTAAYQKVGQSATGLYFGYNPAYSGDYLVGDLAEIAMFNYALTPAQVTSLYNAGTSAVVVPYVAATPRQLVSIGHNNSNMFGGLYTAAAALSAPTQNAPSTATTGGTGLAAATAYSYVVTTLFNGGETTKSNEQTITTGAGTTNSNVINWTAVASASGYHIFRGTAAGGENVFYSVGNVTTFTDTGAASTAGTPPTTNGTADLGGCSAYNFKIAFACKTIRARWVFYASGANGETTQGISTPSTFQAAIQETANTGTPVMLTFSSVNNIAPQPGAEVGCDFYTSSAGFTAGQAVQIRTMIVVAAGGKFPIGPLDYAGISGLGNAGNNYAQTTSVQTNPAGVNALLTTGDCSGWRRGNFTSCMAPVQLEGYASDGVWRPIVAGTGDSIMQGYAEGADGTGGTFVRAMQQMNFPYMNIGQASDTVGSMTQPDHYAGRLRRVDFATCIISEPGTNDLYGSTTFATLRANTLLMWRMMAGRGQPIIPVTILPRPASSTNTWASSTGQTPATNLSTYQQFNAWLRAAPSAGANASSIYDAAQYGIIVLPPIDCAALVETNSANAAPSLSSPFTTGYWYCGSTNAVQWTKDGVHPEGVAVTAMIPAYTAMQASIQATAPPRAIATSSRFVRRS